jgi:type I restriction enzyme S subunit
MPSRYLLYALRATVGALVEKSTGSTFEAINGSDLRSHVIPLPPLDEQLQIVAEIEKQFTRLEAGMAALKRVQANLKRYRAANLKAACEGRLVPTEADLARKEGRSYETGDQLLARILTERRRNWRGRGKYKEPVSPDTTNLPPLPEGWTWASVGQLGEIKGGKRLPMGHEYSPTPTAFPYIRVVDFEHYGVSQDELKFLCDETQKEIQRYTISKNDVYISIAGSIGVVGVVPDNLDGANLTENAAKITSLSFVEKKYICFWLSSNAGRSFVADKTIATTQPKLALFRIEVIPISLPPLAEQSRIVAEVERRLSVIEEQEAAVSTSLQRAARLRQSILQRAFSGGLVYNGT